VDIFVEHLDGDRLRQYAGGLRRRQIHADVITGTEAVTGLRRSPTHEDLPLLNELLEVGARIRGELARQKAVKPLADISGRHGNFGHS
jgi:hypothetical protein